MILGVVLGDVDDVFVLATAGEVFVAKNNTQYMWSVMPFGPVNGPVMSIVMTHDLDCTWKLVAHSRGIPIRSGNQGTHIIVDDIFS